MAQYTAAGPESKIQIPLVKTVKLSRTKDHQLKHITCCLWDTIWLFHEGGLCHIKTIPLICRVSQWNAVIHKNCWDSLYFHEKVLKNCWTCLKIPRVPSSRWFNVVPSLEKLCQAVVVRNNQASLKPTLNKRAWSASITIFVTDCLQN